MLRNYKAKNPHFWLGVFLLIFSASIIDTFLKLINFQILVPAIEWTYYRVLSLIPFTLWIYVSKIAKGRFEFTGFEKLLTTLICLETIFRIYSFIVSALGYQEWSRYNDIVLDTWLETTIIGFTLWTITKVINLVNRHQEQLKNNYSSKSEATNLQWIKELLIILIIVTSIWILAVPFSYFLEGFYLSLYWIWTAQALLIFYFGVKGHSQPEIFHKFSLAPSFNEQQENEPALIPEEFAVQIKLIEDAINVDRIFTKPKLSLQEMASHIKISPRQLSAIINQTYHCSFSDFINQHRVEEVKKRIRNKDNNQLTLIAIAYEAGFNSKSSFNAMFKKFTGKTPNQF